MVKQLLSKTLLLVAVLCTGATAAWADYVTVGSFSAADVVTGKSYVAYENADWSLSSGGNDWSVGFNGTAANAKKIGDALGTAANANYYGAVIKSKSTLNNVSQITFTYQSIGKGTTGKIYLAYSTDGSNWNAITLTEGTQGATIAQNMTFKFNEIASAYYGIVLEKNDQTGMFRYDNVVATFDKYTSEVVKKDVATLNGISPTTLTVGEMDDFVLNATFVEGLTEDEDYEINWSSDNASVLEVTGATYKALAAGTANVTVSVTVFNDDLYNEVSKTFAVTVEEPASVVDGFFDFTYSDKLDYGTELEPGTYSDNSYETTDITWRAGNVTLVSSGKYRWWYNASGSTLRLYSDDNSAVAISVPYGYEITGIAVTGGQLLRSEDGKYSSSNGKWSGNAQSVKLYYNASSGNVAIKTITVTYNKVTSLTATVTAAGWATFVPKYNVKADKVNAYVVSLADDEIALLEKVTEIPAGTPVLLETAGTYTLDVIESAAAVGDNCLKVSDGTISAGNHVYVLGQKNEKTGFYLWTGEALDKGKVYMQTNSSNARQMLQIVKPGQEETGIEAVESAGAEREGIYNLQGIRVAEPRKGLYVVGGKKVMFNK